MKRALTIAAMLALALPTLAVAQEHDDHHPPGKPGPHGPPPHGPAPGPHVVAPHAVIHGPAVVGHNWTYHGHPYAWHPVHFPHPWAYPPGYAYRLWGVGAILPPLFWSTPTYYYADWASMGLPPPDPGFQYVQYGPDLLLVNIATGEVVQAFPGAFE
jgi:hypothetical protein